jgi:serine/threonine-protein kinase
LSIREGSEDSLESATIVDANGHDFPIGGDNGLLEAGEEVGEYVVEAPIGRGGMGVVYRATHKIIGKSAAIKVLHRAADERQARRLIAEARAVNQICHENIVDVFDFGVLHDGRPFVVMELLLGTPLDALLVPEKPMSVVDALHIVGPIAGALQAAHSQGIVHRDLKPANIYLTDNGAHRPIVKLLDFGIAKFLDADSNQGLTTDGMVLGTLAYMAPEIASGKDVSVQVDTYSLGVMLYQMLVGSLPFTGANSLETLYAHVHTPPPTPTEKHVKLPQSLETLLLKMLAKKPKDRPSLADVQKYASKYSEGAESLHYLTPLKLLATEQRTRRKKWLYVGTGFVSLAVLVAILLSQQTSTAKAVESGQDTTPALELPAAQVAEPAARLDIDAGRDEAAIVEMLSEELIEIHDEDKATASTPESPVKDRVRRTKRRSKKGKGKKGKGGPSDDAPIDPLRSMRKR